MCKVLKLQMSSIQRKVGHSRGGGGHWWSRIGIRYVSGGHCHAASTAALGTHVLRHAISTGHRQCGKLLSDLDFFCYTKSLPNRSLYNWRL